MILIKIKSKHNFIELKKPSPPQLLHPPAGYHGKQMAITRNRLSPELRSDLESIEEEDEDEDDEPIVNSCCLCCNLGAGLLLGAIAFMVRNYHRTGQYDSLPFFSF